MRLSYGRRATTRLDWSDVKADDMPTLTVGTPVEMLAPWGRPCAGCKHYRPFPHNTPGTEHGDLDKCAHPEVMEKSPIRGDFVPVFCGIVARHQFYGKCGREARLWEPMPEPAPEVPEPPKTGLLRFLAVYFMGQWAFRCFPGLWGRKQ
jgi:hypothetical protein